MLEEPFLQALAAKIRGWAPEDPSPLRFAVAFSGGLDSTLLLAALCRLNLQQSLRALHVDHGLHPESAVWEAHCRGVAVELGVAYASVRVQVQAGAGLGMEAAAREARYRALERLLAPGEILLTAHHADDQLETVLLRLCRGSGVRGLRGIVELASFGPGRLGRPLLGLPKAQLRECAQRWRLRWLDDPANQSLAHDRNFLRLAVIPKLTERWPAAPRMAQRLAELMADAEEVLEAMAAHDARALTSPDRVPRAALSTLAPSRQRNLLRHLIRQAGLPMPSAARVEDLRNGLRATRSDAHTQICWPGGEGRIHRDCLYLMRPLGAPSAPGFATRLGMRESWSGPEGRIDFHPTAGPGLPQSWLESGLTLRFRAGGERFHPFERAASLTLTRWLHDQGIVPWMRGRIPLFYRADRLVAVADLGVDRAARDAPPAPSWRVEWTEHPPIR